MVDKVAHEIRERLELLRAGYGYASAACGADILFLEAMLERTPGEIDILLPFNRDEFVKESVDKVGGAPWVERFNRLAGLGTLKETRERRVPFGSTAHNYTESFTLGMATLRARLLETELVPLAVWNGQPGDAPGGTADVVDMWRSKGHDVEVIDTASILARYAPSLSSHRRSLPARSKRKSESLPRKLMAVLFTDTVNSSQLRERQIPAYITHVLGSISLAIDACETGPKIVESRGDGYYFVFESVRDAGLFALDLQRRLDRVDRDRADLPPDLAIRVALHAGPVFSFTDPVTRQPSFTGSHVVQAARIEPIAQAGLVWASESFAALSAVDAKGEFHSRYIGVFALPKNYGSFPIYLVTAGA